MVAALDQNSALLMFDAVSKSWMSTTWSSATIARIVTLLKAKNSIVFICSTPSQKASISS